MKKTQADKDVVFITVFLSLHPTTNEDILPTFWRKQT